MSEDKTTEAQIEAAAIRYHDRPASRPAPVGAEAARAGDRARTAEEGEVSTDQAKITIEAGGHREQKSRVVDRFRTGMRVRHVLFEGGGQGLGTVEDVTSRGVSVVFDRTHGKDQRRSGGLYDDDWFRIMTGKGVLEIVQSGD